MFYKFCYAFIGFGFLSISLGIFANKKFKRFAIEHDFTSLGDFYIIPAIIGFIASVMFFYLAFRSEENVKKYRQDYMKCLDCGEVMKYTNTKNGKCPSCNGDTIELDKYYTQQKNNENQKTKYKKPKRKQK